MKTNLTSSIIVAAMACCSQVFADDIDFARDIQPILNAKCVECHGGVKAAGGFSFVYEDRVLNFEADSGERVVVPGDPGASEMLRRIRSDDEGELMPPPEAHGPLTRAEVSLITRWIQEGAKWSGHWAFEKPVKPKPPFTTFDSIAVNDVDRFLFAKLQAEGLKPGPAEAPGRLLRRLSLALTGLPPDLGELTAFETAYASDPEKAVGAAIDRLMAESGFGERWASMWLDLVRYADSGGLGMDQRRTIWPYRDWVVRAFNDDLPFDQFTVKQIAGDLLPNATTDDLIATACQRNTQTNNEGGTDDEEFRVEAVIDRVNTAWQAWGSITFGCVQCHDHPYDPIRHAEYYQFMAFYNTSADSDLPDDAPRLSVPNDPQRYAESERLRIEHSYLRERIWQAGRDLWSDTDWQAAMLLDVTSQNGTAYSVEQKPTHAEFFTSGTVSTGVQTQIRIPASEFHRQPATALKLTVLPLDPSTSVHSPEWGFVVTNLEAWVVDADDNKVPITFRWSVPDVARLPDQPFQNIEANGKNWGANSRIHHARELVLIPETAISLADGSSLLLHIHCNKSGHGSHPMVIKRGYLSVTSDSRWSEFAGTDSDVRAWKAALEENARKLNRIPGTSLPVMWERPQSLKRPTHIFARGNPLDKADLVDVGLPLSLTKVSPFDRPDSVPGRLQMARWWVSDSNPLTARVFVNRIWEQLFGVGIVPTLEDFGSSGDKPTHPQLLDYLAVRFQKDHRWSVKSIIREIVMSHSYRQSANVSPELTERDPTNRLIARGPRLRLTAEGVRDHALAISGLLSSKVGGPPVRPPLPSAVWKPFDGGDKWETARPGSEDRYRRSIYVYMKRSIPFPSFATFDAPSREFCTPRRLTSNTPLQALVLLNDAAFVECAEAFGERIQTEFTGSTEDKLAQAYRLATGRESDSDQLQELASLHEKVSRAYADSKRPESATWTVVAQVLLNLDEALTY